MLEHIDKNINADNVDIDNIINEHYTHTTKNGVLEDNNSPKPRRNPSRTTAGAGIAKLHPSLENTKACGTSRFTREDHVNTSIDNDAADSALKISDNDKHDTKHCCYLMLDMNDKNKHQTQDTPQTLSYIKQ